MTEQGYDAVVMSEGWVLDPDGDVTFERVYGLDPARGLEPAELRRRVLGGATVCRQRCLTRPWPVLAWLASAEVTSAGLGWSERMRKSDGSRSMAWLHFGCRTRDSCKFRPGFICSGRGGP